MELIGYIGWFICGILAAVIYFKKYKPEKEAGYIGVELMLAISGYFGLFFVLYMWLYSKLFNTKSDKDCNHRWVKLSRHKWCEKCNKTEY